MTEQELESLVATFTRRSDIAKLLPAGGIGVELGVAQGGFSERILKHSKLEYLYSIDMWSGDRGHDVEEYRKAFRKLDPFRARNTMLRMRFDEALSLFPDAYFDFIYIDGYAHTGEDGGRTFRDWYPKLKPGGIIAGDDYHPKWPLTVAEVDRFITANGLKLHVIDCMPEDDWASKYPTWFAVKPLESQPLTISANQFWNAAGPNESVFFVTVKWGTKYSADYVNILYDMVKRNLPRGYRFSFLCFTDDASGILPGVETRSLPSRLNGWWNKLYLFKRGVMPEGARIVFLDLDTAITGDLSGIAAYKGEFAIAYDTYRAGGYNSSLMLWRGGFGDFIWQAYEEAGRPDISGGDQTWIEQCNPKADILQDMFPGQFITFKQHAYLKLPPGARIVCFHGDPKPPQVKNGWVEHVWKIGGAVPAASLSPLTPGDEQSIENVRHALTLPYLWLDTAMPIDSNRHVCLVGGGASANEMIGELKRCQRDGQSIWALNGAFRLLASHGIEPDAHVMFTTNNQRAAEVPEQSKAMLFYASQCDPEVFARAARHSQRVVMWHSLMDGIGELTGGRRAVLIACGATTGMKAIGLAQARGFGNIHLYGFDSSFPKDAVNDERIEIEFDGQIFASSPRLAQQVHDFRLVRQSLALKGIKISVHGEGLLPRAARKLERYGAK